MKLDKQLERALKRIEELNMELGRDPAEDAVIIAHTDPVLVAASQLENTISEVLREVGHRESTASKNKKNAERLASRQENDDLADIYVRQHADAEETLRVCGIHREALEDKLETLARDPQSMFLPLGTIVRLTGELGYETSDGSHRIRGAYPADDTTGVVIRLNSESEWPIAVAFRKNFVDCHGDEWRPSDHRFHTHHFDISSLEVVGHGLLPNGEAYSGYGYVATHYADSDDSEERDTEMVLEADGFYWRFTEYGNPKVLEATSAYEDIGQLDFMEDPIEPAGGMKF